MKKTVLDIDDITQKIPFLRNCLCVWLLKKIFRWTALDKVNRVHENHYQLRGSAFTSALLSDPLINVRYEAHNREVLKSLPEGAFITVSNHPIGSLDGIILIDLLASLRPDFRVVVNEILSHISGMEDNFISVIPKTNSNQSTNSQSVNGIRMALSHLRGGHPVGFFPAGAMSFYNRKLKCVRDLPWTHSVIRLIHKANVPVVPIYFDCFNSDFFYRLGRISWRLRTLRVAKEVFNKQGQTLQIYVGTPISPEKIKSFPDDVALAEYLYQTTYATGKENIARIRK